MKVCCLQCKKVVSFNQHLVFALLSASRLVNFSGMPYLDFMIIQYVMTLSKLTTKSFYRCYLSLSSNLTLRHLPFKWATVSIWMQSRNALHDPGEIYTNKRARVYCDASPGFKSHSLPSPYALCLFNPLWIGVWNDDRVNGAEGCNWLLCLTISSLTMSHLWQVAPRRLFQEREGNFLICYVTASPEAILQSMLF